MGKKNQSIKIISLATAIAFGNITVAAAKNTPDDSLSNFRVEAEDNTSGQQFKQASTASLSSFIEPELLRYAEYPKLNLFAQAVQEPANTEQNEDINEIIKPAQQAIPNTEQLNPSSNPLSFPTEAEEVEVGTQQLITIEQAIELSLKNNKDIQEARLQVERSQAELRQERAALFPTLDATSGLTYGNSLFLDSTLEQSIEERAQDNAAANPNISEDLARAAAEDSFTNASSSRFNFTSGLSLNYDIYDGGLRGASIRAAEKQLRSTELNLEAIVEQTRFETASDYYDLQNSDAQVEIQEAAVEDSLQTLRDAQLLERAGLGTRFDVLRAEVELAQARQRLTTAIANQNISRRQLAETLSVSHSTELATADAVEQAGTWNLELAETIVQAFKNRAELEQLLLQREINQEQRTIALSSIRPRLTANANYSVDDDFEDDFDISDSYSVGLNLQWRLFDGGAARAAAEQEDIDAEISETNFADQRNQIRFGVEQAYFQLESNQNNIQTASREVELAQESLRLARLRFQAGVGTQTDVIEAQTQLTTARGNLLSSIIDYNQSYVALQRQVSNTPDNGLQDLP